MAPPMPGGWHHLASQWGFLLLLLTEKESDSQETGLSLSMYFQLSATWQGGDQGHYDGLAGFLGKLY